MQGGISWRLTIEMLGDDVVMAGPNPSNGQSRVLKIDGTSKYFDDALSKNDKYILCGGHHSKVGCMSEAHPMLLRYDRRKERKVNEFL
jgi:hypothetical protein